MCRPVKPSLCKGRGTAAGGGRVAVNKIDNPSDGIRRQLPLHRGAKATGKQRPLHKGAKATGKQRPLHKGAKATGKQRPLGKGANNALSKTALMRKLPV